MIFDAVVLAGGRATRLGGADKATVEVAGATLLERALAAVSAARTVVVVGDQHPTSREVLWVRESPAYGGPVAATYAGVDALLRGSPVQTAAEEARMTGQMHGSTPPGELVPGLVVVLAVDMPEVTAGTVRRLVEAAEEYDGAVLVDGGRRHLAFAARRDALERVRPGPVEGAAMRRLWADLQLADVPAAGGEAHDIDQWSDLTPT